MPRGRQPKKPVIVDGIEFWTCARCGVNKTADNYKAQKKAKNGLHSWCKKCDRLYMRPYMRTYMPSYKEKNNIPSTIPAHVRKKYNESNPEKIKARNALNNAIVQGVLKREPCEVCGDVAQGHHPDYSKPLDVNWLCTTHHAKLHVEEREEPNG